MIRIQPQELVLKLREQGYICDENFAKRVVLSMATRPTAGAFLAGPPGIGKTFLPECLGRAFNGAYHFQQMFPGSREDDLIQKIVPDPQHPAGIGLREGVMVKASVDSHDRISFLVLDEWDKSIPSADAFMLDFLQHGRLRFDGKDYWANQDNLIVFITMNDERTISEPLKRRLPYIIMKPLTPTQVAQALQLSRPDHKAIQACVALYVRSLCADLPKPVTVQELVQVLDGIDTLGEGADWTMLLHTLAFKEPHEMQAMKAAEKLNASQVIQRVKEIFSKEEVDLTESRYAAIDGISDIQTEATRHKFILPFDPNWKVTTDITDPARADGILLNEPDIYNALLSLTGIPKTAESLAEYASIENGKIVFTKPISIYDIHRLTGAFGDKLVGEIVVNDPRVGLNHLKALRASRKILFIKASSDEVIARTGAKFDESHAPLDLRWTPTNGLSVIVPISSSGMESLIEIMESPYLYGDFVRQFPFGTMSYEEVPSLRVETRPSMGESFIKNIGHWMLGAGSRKDGSVIDLLVSEMVSTSEQLREILEEGEDVSLAGFKTTRINDNYLVHQIGGRAYRGVLETRVSILLNGAEFVGSDNFKELAKNIVLIRNGLNTMVIREVFNLEKFNEEFGEKLSGIYYGADITFTVSESTPERVLALSRIVYDHLCAEFQKSYDGWRNGKAQS